MPLVPVDKALAQILKGAKPLASEFVPLTNAYNRILAAPLRAERAQPPFAASAMTWQKTMPLPSALVIPSLSRPLPVVVAVACGWCIPTRTCPMPCN